MCIFYVFEEEGEKKRPQQKVAGGGTPSRVAIAFRHFPAFFIIRNISNQWLRKGRVK